MRVQRVCSPFSVSVVKSVLASQMQSIPYSRHFRSQNVALRMTYFTHEYAKLDKKHIMMQPFSLMLFPLVSKP